MSSECIRPGPVAALQASWSLQEHFGSSVAVEEVANVQPPSCPGLRADVQRFPGL